MKLILLSDDKKLKALVMDQKQYDPHVCSSAEEARSNLDGDKLNILLLDFDMGAKEEGDSEVKELNKSLISYDMTMRVVVSGSMATKDFIRHQKSLQGADGYLVKPVSKKTIQSLVDDFECAMTMGGEPSGATDPGLSDSSRSMSMTFVGAIDLVNEDGEKDKKDSKDS